MRYAWKFGVVKKYRDHTLVSDAWQKVFALKRGPNFSKMVFIEKTDDKSTLFSEHFLKLLRPSFSQEISFKHFIIENRHVKVIKRTRQKTCEVSIFSSKRERYAILVSLSTLFEPAVCA